MKEPSLRTKLKKMEGRRHPNREIKKRRRAAEGTARNFLTRLTQ